VRQVPKVCRYQSLVRRKVVLYPQLRVSWKKPNSSDSQTVLPPGPWDTRKLVTYRRRSGSGEDTLGDLRDGLNRIEKASVGHRKSNICNQELQRIQVFPTEIPNLMVVEPQDADDFVGKGYGNGLGLVFSSNLSLLRGSNGLPLTLILKTV
jgi:hypothetical protein